MEYTYNELVATLAMIETPTATAFALDSPKTDQAPLLDVDEKLSEKITTTAAPDLLLVQQKPITGKIRRTLKHLRTQAGPWSRFRGFHVATLYNFVTSLLIATFSSFTNSLAMEFVSIIMAALITCRLQMAWTHIVISTPSSQPWYRRIPSVQSAKNIILPTAVLAAAHEVNSLVPLEIFRIFGLSPYLGNPKLFTERPMNNVRDQLLIPVCLGLLASLFISLFIVLPATVTLIRVQASMLPREYEAIVPFDRTFGGRVQPESVGGSGAVSMLDAWKTFDWAARIRLVKLYIKIFALYTVTTVVVFGLAKLAIQF